MKKKGFIFTLDSVIALILVLSIFTFTMNILTTRTVSPQINYEQMHYYAEDSMTMISELDILDEVGDKWISGSCTAWDDNNLCNDASDLINLTLNDVIPKNTGYRFRFGDDVVAMSGSTRPEIWNTSGVAISTRVASGYTSGKPKTGYIARAYATKIGERTTTIMLPFHPSGSGWQAKEFEVIKEFELPADADIENATLYLSINYGSSQSYPEFKELKVNGIQRKTDIVWLYTQQEEYYQSTAAFGRVYVTSDLQAGNNTISMRIGSPHYNSHIHPGMFLKVAFKSNESLIDIGLVEKREYFDYIKGDPGVWAIIPYTIPEGSTDISATLHLEAESIFDHPNEYATFGHYDVEIYVNSNETAFEDANPGVNPVYNLSLDPFTIAGTNVIAIYLNCYGDTAWGNKETIIKNSSYIDISYNYSEALQYGYGEIDISKVALFGGNATNPKQGEFFIPAEASPLIETFVYVAEGFTNMVNTSAWRIAGTPSLTFESKSSRAVPTDIYIHPSKLLTNNTNYIKLTDFWPNGTVNTMDKFLPWSHFQYTFLARLSVSYGNVFNTQAEAQEDAISRLEAKAQEYDIDWGEIDFVNETTTSPDIPSLWGPTRFALEIWQ